MTELHRFFVRRAGAALQYGCSAAIGHVGRLLFDLPRTRRRSPAQVHPVGGGASNSMLGLVRIHPPRDDVRAGV